MPTFFFTNALMLAGLAGLGIPVLIHLLLKRRKKRVQFSTVRFFQQQDEQSSRRRKLRNWFLLALRLLIVTLLVLAFSRPFSKQNGAAASDRRQNRVVFVLDRSASMFATGTDGQRWALAKDKIQKILSELTSDDRAALVDCATHANVLSGFAPPANVGQLLRDLAPSYGTSNLGDGLREATRLLSSRSSARTCSIYVVSDLQKSGCRALGAYPIPQDIDVKVIPVGDVIAPNLAIIGMDTVSRDGVRPQATVANFSDEDSLASALEIHIDDKLVSSLGLALKPGAITNVDLAFPGLKPGWHDIKASLRTKDAFEADNARYASLWVPQPAQILVVEPRNSGHVFEQESFFLVSALDPTKDSTNSTPGPFNLIQIAPEQLTSKLAASKEGQWNVVILPGLKDLPLGIGKSLAAFVDGGGGLVLFLGEGMSANRYNSELPSLLPARIGAAEECPEPTAPWRIALYDTNSLAFSAFRTPNSGDLRIPGFSQRYSLELSEGSKRLAFFEDGVPLVVTRAFGKGKVVLVNTTATTAWNDWPKHKTFVPFVHGLARYGAQHSEETSVRDNETYTAGEDTELDTGTEGRLASFTLRAPAGTETRFTADPQGKLREPGLKVPGLYSLRDKSGKEVRRFAVNLPAQESNLEALRAVDFQQQLVRVQETQKETLAAGLFGSRNDQREFWQALLLAALVLLLVEPFIANRTSV